MKALVAVTCIAVLGAAGYYFYGEFQSRRERVADQGRLDSVRAELFSLARAEPGDSKRVEEFCQGMKTNIDSGRTADPMAKQVVINCRALDFL